MDRKTWPWKKKSSDKAVAADKVAAAASETAGASLGDQDNYKKPNYVQISIEAYSHLTGLEDHVKTFEDQVKTLEDQIKDMDEKLSTAHSEMTTKDNLVKQHAKVAEEAVSGWEKADEEALALKNHLESVTLLKLTAEDRASHLDGALKECMRQIRNLKEEHEQKLHEVVLTKSKHLENLKLELQTKIGNLEQELLHSKAENAVISRSLQERCNMLIQMSEEKSQAEADIEVLKGNIESCEREINSLKYELHLASKELEIRNEENKMSIKSAEVASKQHLEGVKKITKLEAECQRLRGLVRKKLPGPAALAQMKLEVESLGGDSRETRIKKSPGRSPHGYMSPLPDFSLEDVQRCHKENEILTERILAMEEETKMLKEALAARNGELQASRNISAKTASRIQSLEMQLQNNKQQKVSPKSIAQTPIEVYSSQNGSNPPSLTSVSEDGNDDGASCGESWAITSISELSQFNKEKNIEKPKKVVNVNHLEFMDDFLEMEKLANLPNDSNGGMTVSNISNPEEGESETLNYDTSVESGTGKDLLAEPPHQLVPLAIPLSSTMDPSAPIQPLERLQSRISMVFESKDTDLAKILEDIKRIVEETQYNSQQQTVNCVFKEIHCPDSTCDKQVCPEGDEGAPEKEISLQGIKQGTESLHVMSKELAIAISHIHDFLLFLEKEGTKFLSTSRDGGLKQKIEEFSATTNKVLCCKMSLVDFVHELSHVLAETSELGYNAVGYRGNEVEANGFDCVDKVVLPENKEVWDLVGERDAEGVQHISDSTSDPGVPHSDLVIGSKSSGTLCQCSFEEVEQIKSEKEKLLLDLKRCTEDLECTKSELQEKGQLLVDVKSQLASAQKTNSLAETQLKCMAESYKSLENRAEELETEVNLLRVKTENLENELQEEKKCHQNALEKWENLQEKLKRNESCADANLDPKTKQDIELAAATEKLAECQETIFLLGKQLNALCPQREAAVGSYSERSQRGENIPEDGAAAGNLNLEDLHQIERTNSAASANVERVGNESPLDHYNAPSSMPETNSNVVLRSTVSPQRSQKDRPLMPSLSSSSSCPTPEKHSRSFSRFFSPKGRSSH